MENIPIGGAHLHIGGQQTLSNDSSSDDRPRTLFHVTAKIFGENGNFGDLVRVAKLRTGFKTLWIGEPLAGPADLSGGKEHIDAWKTLR